MASRFLTLIPLFAICLLSVQAQENIQLFTDRNSFLAAASDVRVVDFEGIVPNSGFKHYQREGALTYAGIEFRPGGGAKFGPGPLIVVGAWYQAGPAYETTTGAKLHWSTPNQPGSAFLTVTLPVGVTAVGTDLWSVPPSASTIEVTVTTADGRSRTESVTTPARPAAGFIGFTSGSPIVSLRITPPKGQSGLIVDNFTIGKSSLARSGNDATRNENPRSEPRPPITATIGPRDRPLGQATAPPASNSEPRRRGVFIDPQGPSRQGSQPSAGAIAYVRGSTEIRLINPDGANDRQLWTHPDLNEQLGIFEMAWKPDGTELAFSSAHEATASPYMADIYSIRADGSGLRKLTNPPERSGLGRFPKGSVTVNVNNSLLVSDTPANFIVYVVGADEPQQVSIPSGATKAITFKSVADFGRQPQMLVAISGNRRWFVPGVDVLPGRTVSSPILPISGPGFEMHGAFRPVWRADGSRISFRSGLCLVSSAPTTPVPGSLAFNPFFAGKNPLGTCTWDWGPTPATANQVIYSENSAGSNIYQMTEGGAHPGTKLTAFSDLDYQLATDLRWMPDGSGLLYSTVNTFRDSSNIFRYDFATKRTTPVTRLDKEFARMFSISPDSRSVVFERCADREKDEGCDLWTIGTDGSSARLLVRNGQRPAWGR
jgi:hypothetical protein